MHCDCTNIHIRSEHLAFIAPAFLGVMHRDVGVSEYSFGILAVVWVKADADAQGDVEPMSIYVMGFSHGIDQLFGTEGSVMYALDFSQQYRKFVAALSAEGIQGANAGLQAFCDRLQ